MRPLADWGRRRILLAASALASPFMSMAQTALAKQATVGYLNSAGRSRDDSPSARGILDGLAAAGWIEERNLKFDERYGAGNLESTPQLAADLVWAMPQVIVAALGGTDALALKRATGSIPIVATNVLDPVSLGLAQTLAHPGGNVTGVIWADIGLGAKLVELIRDAMPRAKRIAVLHQPDGLAGVEPYIVAMERAAKLLGLSMMRSLVRRREDLVPAFEGLRAAGIEAFVLTGTALTIAQRQTIAELAIQYQLASFTVLPLFVDAGMLMSYSPNAADAYSRVAAQVDRILRGAKPAEMPFEYPTRYELVVNGKTALAIGVTLSPAILARSDRVVN